MPKKHRKKTRKPTSTSALHLENSATPLLNNTLPTNHAQNDSNSYLDEKNVNDPPPTHAVTINVIGVKSEEEEEEQHSNHTPLLINGTHTNYSSLHGADFPSPNGVNHNGMKFPTSTSIADETKNPKPQSSNFIVVIIYLGKGVVLVTAVGSEIAYAYFSRLTSMDSIRDMLNYLFSNQQTNRVVIKYSGRVFMFGAFADSALTCLSFANAGTRFHQLAEGFHKGMEDYKKGHVGWKMLAANSILFSFQFVTGAFSPLAGLMGLLQTGRGELNESLSKKVGWSSVPGQVFTYYLSYAPDIFSGARRGTNFYYSIPCTHKCALLMAVLKSTLPNWKSWSVLGRLVLMPLWETIIWKVWTRENIFLSTLVSVGTRAMGFYGLSAAYVAPFVFGLSPSSTGVQTYAVLSAISAAYTTAMSQSVDNLKTFLDNYIEKLKETEAVVAKKSNYLYLGQAHDAKLFKSNVQEKLKKIMETIFSTTEDGKLSPKEKNLEKEQFFLQNEIKQLDKVTAQKDENCLEKYWENLDIRIDKLDKELLAAQTEREKLQLVRDKFFEGDDESVTAPLPKITNPVAKAPLIAIFSVCVLGAALTRTMGTPDSWGVDIDSQPELWFFALTMGLLFSTPPYIIWMGKRGYEGLFEVAYSLSRCFGCCSPASSATVEEIDADDEDKPSTYNQLANHSEVKAVGSQPAADVVVTDIPFTATSSLYDTSSSQHDNAHKQNSNRSCWSKFTSCCGLFSSRSSSAPTSTDDAYGPLLDGSANTNNNNYHSSSASNDAGHGDTGAPPKTHSAS